MKPKFADSVAWQQAQILMQPVFIRLIDNIRKQLERSPWKGTYQDVQIWPEGTSEDTKANVANLQQQLQDSPEQQAEIQAALSQLPQAYPGYQLWLSSQQHEVHVDLWELCYQICFVNYTPPQQELDQASSHEMTEAAQIDTSLLDETGDVDWNRLDEKAKETVAQVFSRLPKVESSLSE